MSKKIRIQIGSTQHIAIGRKSVIALVKKAYQAVNSGQMVTFPNGTTKFSTVNPVINFNKTGSNQYIFNKTGTRIKHIKTFCTSYKNGHSTTTNRVVYLSF